MLPPLSAKFARKRFLVGVRHHVSPQVFLVLGGKATAWTLVRAEIGMLPHVSLTTKRYQLQGQKIQDRNILDMTETPKKDDIDS